MTIAWSPICLNAAYDPSANPALTGTPFTVTARSVRGMPTRYTSPACTWPALPSACSTAFQSGSAAPENPGVATSANVSGPIMCLNILDLMAIVPPCQPRAVLPSVQLLCDGLPIRAFEQGDLGHRMIVLHRRHDTDGAVPGVGLHGVGRRGRECPLCFRHRLALLLGVLQVIPLGDRLG